MKISMLGLTLALLVSGCSHKFEKAVAPPEQAKTPTSGSTNSATLKIPFRLGTVESNAALFGRECGVIWFASQSRTTKEAPMEKDIITAVTAAKALGVSCSEEQLRNTFNESEHTVMHDFITVFPEMINKAKGTKVRDIYLFSFWCTGARNWVWLVPLWNTPKKQEVARQWVATPLGEAEKAANPYDPEVASACHKLGIRSLTVPLDTFNEAITFSDEILKVQKKFLSKYMTADHVEMVDQSYLERRR
jgi:hypothetical protein